MVLLHALSEMNAGFRFFFSLSKVTRALLRQEYELSELNNFKPG